jgi:glycosyltransferase involved in cell wall biosynthesis
MLVLFVGNYLPLHGVDVIVRAAKLLEDEPAVRFKLVGRGQTFPDIEHYVAETGLGNVELLPRVPFDVLPSIISDAAVSLGVFGSTNKAGRVVANKVYQSMAMGVPVVTSDSPAAREFFHDGEDICLVPRNDAVALADKIRYLYGDPTARQEIGRRGAELVRERYSSVAVASRLLDFCRELIS